MFFYEILNEIMQKQQLKVADVARLCGLADSTVRSIFSRKQKTVALDVAFKLSDGLNVSLKTLNSGDFSALKKDNVSLSDTEKNLIAIYRELSPQGQEYVLQTIDMVKDKYKKDILPSNAEDVG